MKHTRAVFGAQTSFGLLEKASVLFLVEHVLRLHQRAHCETAHLLFVHELTTQKTSFNGSSFEVVTRAITSLSPALAYLCVAMCE